MKKVLIIYLFILIPIVESYSQSKLIESLYFEIIGFTDLEKMNLLGNVSSLKVDYYSNDNTFFEARKYLFNKDGNISKSTIYNEYRTKINWKNYIYNDDGTLRMTEEYYHFWSDSIAVRTMYSYDTSKRLLMTKTYDYTKSSEINGSLEITYDNLNRIQATNRKDFSYGKREFFTTYSYDSKDNVIKLLTKKSNFKNPSELFFNYDSDKNLIKIDDKQSFSDKLIYKYNKKGLTIEAGTEYYRNNKYLSSEITIHKYTLFDSKYNYLRKTILKEGDVTFYQIRTIKYYE